MDIHRSHPWYFSLVVLAPLLLALSCGGSSPASPSVTARLSILSSTDVLAVGASVDMRLEVVFSDGRNTMITPTWGTDRPDLVLVKPLSASRQGATPEEGKTGVIDHMLFARVTGLAPGDALVTADSRYGACTRAVRVILAE